MPDPVRGMPSASTPDALPRPFDGHDVLVVRPDHVVAAVGTAGTIDWNTQTCARTAVTADAD